MRTSVASISKKLLSTFFAATLALGLVPIAAFAIEDGDAAVSQNSQDADASSNIQAGAEASANENDPTVEPNDLAASGDPHVIPGDGEESVLIEQNEDEALITSWEEDQATAIPAAMERVNEDVTLQARTVAQVESTRSYFLAETLENTRTVPIVSANLPLDMTVVGDTIAEPETEGEEFAFQEEEGEDSDDPDSEGDEAPAGANYSFYPINEDSAVSAESTVIGSFTYLGMTFAIEPGGESVALMAVDYNQLPHTYIVNQVIVIPDAVTPDDIDYYSVTRIADNAFSSLAKETANPDYTGCIDLFSNEELLAEAGIDSSEVEAFLSPDTNMIDIDGDGEMDTVANPLKDCAGIVAMSIPANVSSIEDKAFSGCDTLQYLVVSEDNLQYASYDGALYSTDLTNLRLIPEGRVGAVRVAPSATTVDPEAFSHCPSVDTVVADPESETPHLFEGFYVGRTANRPNLPRLVSADQIHFPSSLSLFDLLDILSCCLQKVSAAIPFSSPLPAIEPSMRSAYNVTVSSTSTSALTTFNIDLSLQDCIGGIKKETVSNGIDSWDVFFRTESARDLAKRWGPLLGPSWNFVSSYSRYLPFYCSFETDLFPNTIFELESSAYISPWLNYRSACATLTGRFDLFKYKSNTMNKNYGCGDSSTMYASCSLLPEAADVTPVSHKTKEYTLKSNLVTGFSSHPFTAPNNEYGSFKYDTDLGYYASYTWEEISCTAHGSPTQYVSPFFAQRNDWAPTTSTLFAASVNSVTGKLRVWNDTGKVSSENVSLDGNSMMLLEPTEDLKTTCWFPGSGVIVDPSFADNDAVGTPAVLSRPASLADSDSITHPAAAATDPTKAFFGWNEDPNATPATETGWWFKNGAAIKSEQDEPTVNLYAVYSGDYLFEWDVTKYGGDPFEIDLRPANTKNTLSVSNTGATELVGIVESDTLTGYVRFPELRDLPSGARFLGWTTNEDGLAPVGGYFSYDDGMYAVSPTGLICQSNGRTFDADTTTMTWYAVWTASAVWDMGTFGGQGLHTQTGLFNNKSYAPPAIDEDRGDGWIFRGWAIMDENGDLNVPSKPENFVLNGDTTFYALWGVRAEWVDGDSAISQDDILYGTAPSDTWPMVNDREGYVLAGWRSSADNETYKLDDPVPALTEPTTFTAVWSAGESTISFDVNRAGLESLETTSTATYNQDLLSLPKEAVLGDSDGFVFAGYFDAANRQYFDAKGEPTIDQWDKTDAEVTLYAHWKYKVYFDKNDDEAKASLVKLIGGTGEETIVIHDEDVEGKTAWMWATYHGTNEAIAYPTVYIPGAIRMNYTDDDGTSGSFSDLLQWSYAGGSVGAGVQLEPANAFDEYLTEVEGVKAVTLKADWKGVATKYTVRLIASTPFAGGPGADAISAVEIENDATRTKTIEKVPYGSLVSEGTPDTENWPIAVPIPEGSQHVRFTGYYGRPNAAASDYCYVNADGTVDESNRMLDRSTLNANGEVELYARWEVADCTVSFVLTDAKGDEALIASLTPDPIQKLRQGDEMPVLSWGDDTSPAGKIPERDGYTFRGFFDEDGIQYYGPNLEKTSEDITWQSAYYANTLYARWTYEVQLDLNLGDAGTVRASDAVFAKDGSELKAQDDASQIVKVKANEYTVSDARDAFSFSEDAAGTNVIPTGLSRTRDGEATGYTFAGFTTERGKASTLIDDAWLADEEKNPTVLLPSGTTPATLYALWEAVTYNVALEANDYDGFAFGGCLQEVADGRTETVSASYDASLSGAIDVPEMRGYVFLGYFDAKQEAPASSEEEYAPEGMTMFFDRDGNPQNAPWTDINGTVLYAHYYQRPYAITFVPGEGALGGSDPLPVFYGYKLEGVTAGTASLKGYAFQGWQDEAGTLYFDAYGRGQDIAFGVGDGELADVALTPVWEGKTYTITWKYNHGTFQAHTTSSYTVNDVLYGKSFDELPIPTNPRYTFWGWFPDQIAAGDATADNGTSAIVGADKWFTVQDGKYVFAPPTEIDEGSSVTFWAAWDKSKPIQYKITLNVGKGPNPTFGAPGTSVTETSVPIPYDPAKPNGTIDIYEDVYVPYPNLAGWRFVGWKGEDGEMLIEGTEIAFGSGYYYYTAQWEVEKEGAYSITFLKGDEVSGGLASPDALDWYFEGDREYIALDKVCEDFDVSYETVRVPVFTKIETPGYDFGGWERVEKDADGNWQKVEASPTVSFTTIDKTERSFLGQALVQTASNEQVTSFTFRAVWKPKTFEVRYFMEEGLDENGEPVYQRMVMSDVDAKDWLEVFYDAEITLPEPAFKNVGAIFERWDAKDRTASSTSKLTLLPGKRFTLRDIVTEVSARCISQDEDHTNVISLYGITAPGMSFTVPLEVTVAFDLERPEESMIPGRVPITTTQTKPVEVKSIELSRYGTDENLIIQNEADGSSYVDLLVQGYRDADGADIDKSGYMPINLGKHNEGVRYHADDLANHGFGTFTAGSPLNVEYRLTLALPGGKGLTGNSFTELLGIRDEQDADGTRASLPIAKLFYTVGLA